MEVLQMTSDFHVDMNEYLPLRDVVFNTLRQAILRGELKPGERLMEIATAPWLVVVPIYGAGLDLLALREGVGNPLCSVLLRPPVDVWDRTVVLIGRNQSVGNAALGWHWRREFYLSLCGESCRS